MARDIFRRPLTGEEIADLAARAGSVQALFSWKSPSARSLKLDPANVDDARLLALMQGEPRLIRRPLLLMDRQLIIGADPKTLERLLG